MVTVRYFAAARAAAGVETETVQVPPGATVDILLKTVRGAHGDDMGRVLDRCSFLLEEVGARPRPPAARRRARRRAAPLRRRLKHQPPSPCTPSVAAVPARSYSPYTSGFFPNFSASGAAQGKGARFV